MKYFGTLFFLLFFLATVSAQKSFRFENTPEVEVNGNKLSAPFAGGINAAQIQSMDVTGDGREEIIIWDRNSRRLLVFSEEENSYTHRPALSYAFPEDVNSFLILVDFNGNGRKDLFTSSPFGIKAYRNTGHANQVPVWEVAENFLRLEGGSNLQANNLDVPIIMDIDGDGDLDIVTFNFAAGDYLEYYKNTSVERKGTPDIDGFASARVRWGNFEFCGCGVFSFGFTCGGNPILSNEIVEQNNLRITHIGGHSMLLHDFTGNGLLDLLMGQDECNTLYFLPNSGTNESPIYAEYSTILPGLGTLPSFPIFHIASLYRNDLIISINASNRSVEYQIDFSKSLRLFPREEAGWGNNPINFLQKDMIDLGENARPYFKGNSSVGELEVSSNQLVDGQVIGRITRFTLSQNGFQRMEEDINQLSSLQLTDLQFQEIDNNYFISGVSTVNFNQVRMLYYSAGHMDLNNPQQINFPEITLRANDHLEFYKYENQFYLLLARQTGELIRYRVTFDPNPVFTLLERNYLGYNDNPATRNITVHVVQEPGRGPDLYAIDQRGRLQLIEDFHHHNQVQEQILGIGNNLRETRFGRINWITSIPNVFNGKVDLVVGTAAGGLIFLSQSSHSVPGQEDILQVRAYPNPTENFINLVASENVSVQIINSLGQTMEESLIIQANIPTQISLLSYARGMYYLRIKSEKGHNLTKKVIKR